MKIEKGENLKLGSKPKPKRVKDLKQELKKAGIWKGPVTQGPFTKELDSAVRQFQARFPEFGQDGHAGATTGALLNGYVRGLQDCEDQAPGETEQLEKENIDLKRDVIKHLEKLYKKADPEGKCEIAEKLYLWRNRLIEELGPAKDGTTDDDKTGSGIPEDPKAPGDSQVEREAFAAAVKAQITAWMGIHGCCNLDPCTLVAQWMHESDWGRSTAAKVGRNLGGIKGKGPEGSVRVGNLTYRKYKNFSQFYQDYCRIICHSERYENARGKRAEAYYKAIKDAGYAEDPGYVDKLMKIYKQICE